MSTDPDRIRHDIETTRAELSHDVDALAHRADPRRIAAAPVNRARSRFSQLVDDVMGTARHAGRSTRRQGADLGHRVSDLAQHSADAATSAAHQASGAASSAVHQASGAASSAAHQASGAASSVGHQVQAIGHTSRARAEGNPLAAGLIAFGVGLLAASLLPASRREHDLADRGRHLVTEHSDQIRQHAGGMVRQLQDNLREPAQHATEAVRSTAAEGTTAVRDTGREAAQHLRDDAQQAQRRL